MFVVIGLIAVLFVVNVLLGLLVAGVFGIGPLRASAFALFINDPYIRPPRWFLVFLFAVKRLSQIPLPRAKGLPWMATARARLRLGVQRVTYVIRRWLLLRR
jgi:hypothetical protein